MTLNFSSFLFLSRQKFKSYYDSFFLFFFRLIIVSQSGSKCQYPLYQSQKPFLATLFLQPILLRLNGFERSQGLFRTFQGASQIYSSMQFYSERLIVVCFYRSKIGLYAVVMLIGQSCQGYTVLIALKGFYGLYRGIVLLLLLCLSLLCLFFYLIFFSLRSKKIIPIAIVMYVVIIYYLLLYIIIYYYIEYRVQYIVYILYNILLYIII